MAGYAGTQFVSNQTDIAVGVSGKATRVFFVEQTSGGTAAVVILHNGTSTSGSAYSTINGTINLQATRYYGEEGMFFPAGCFLNVDANTTSATVTYRQEMS